MNEALIWYSETKRQNLKLLPNFSNNMPKEKIGIISVDNNGLLSIHDKSSGELVLTKNLNEVTVKKPLPIGGTGPSARLTDWRLRPGAAIFKADDTSLVLVFLSDEDKRRLEVGEPGIDDSVTSYNISVIEGRKFAKAIKLNGKNRDSKAKEFWEPYASTLKKFDYGARVKMFWIINAVFWTVLFALVLVSQNP